MFVIDKAIKILKKGGLVAFPTETVYGLGADAKNPKALKKIFAAKGRPIDHPLIVHIAETAALSDWACDIPEEAWILANAFWPGPLTLILKKAPGVPDLVTGGQDTIGLRVPNHPVALELLKKFGSGLAAPSANRFGRVSPTTAQAVVEELGERVGLVLDGGSCNVGVESTILDLSGPEVTILRPGMITSSQIETLLNKPVRTFKKNAPRVSGALESHYAPQTKVQIVSTQELQQFNDPSMVIVARSKGSFKNQIFMPADPEAYAHVLYQTLRELDKKNFKEIIIEEIPEKAEWDAIRDRLKKMAVKNSRV